MIERKKKRPVKIIIKEKEIKENRKLNQIKRKLYAPKRR